MGRDTVLITGGSGTLGKALTRRLSSAGHNIVVYSRDEGKHPYFADNDKVVTEIGDIRDKERLRDVCVRHKVKHIIHTAALKRIDDLERAITECYRTNVEGTINVVQVADELDMIDMMFISTDKACSPVNAYGASKFMAERYIQKYAAVNNTKYYIVRYGNVFASRGSFIPLWNDNIQQGKPIKITDARCTRFLFTLEESVDLILSAYELARDRAIIVPKLNAYKIEDLAHDLMALNGVNVPIEYIGMRPGEKLHEQMINETESLRVQIAESNPNVFIIPDTDKLFDFTPGRNNQLISYAHDDLANLFGLDSWNVAGLEYSSEFSVCDDADFRNALIEKGLKEAFD